MSDLVIYFVYFIGVERTLFTYIVVYRGARQRPEQEVLEDS